MLGAMLRNIVGIALMAVGGLCFWPAAAGALLEFLGIHQRDWIDLLGLAGAGLCLALLGMKLFKVRSHA